MGNGRGRPRESGVCGDQQDDTSHRTDIYIGSCRPVTICFRCKVKIIYKNKLNIDNILKLRDKKKKNRNR